MEYHTISIGYTIGLLQNISQDQHGRFHGASMGYTAGPAGATSLGSISFSLSH